MIGFDDISGIAKVLLAANKHEEYQKILALQEEITQLRQENQELKQEVTDLKKKWEIQEDLQFRENAYWRSSGEGPFCVPCWDGKKQLMRMTGDGAFYCHTCHYQCETREHAQRVRENAREVSRRFNQW